MSFSVDKVTTGTYNFVFVLNVADVGASILSIVSTRGSAIGLTFLAACVVIQSKYNFQTKLKSEKRHN